MNRTSKNVKAFKSKNSAASKKPLSHHYHEVAFDLERLILEIARTRTYTNKDVVAKIKKLIAKNQNLRSEINTYLSKLPMNNYSAQIRLEEQKLKSYKDPFILSDENLKEFASYFPYEKPRSKPEMPIELAALLYYAIYVLKLNDIELVKIGNLLSVNGPIHKKIDLEFGNDTFAKLYIPSTLTGYDYENNTVRVRWTKRIKAESPKLMRKFIFQNWLLLAFKNNTHIEMQLRHIKSPFKSSKDIMDYDIKKLIPNYNFLRNTLLGFVTESEDYE